MQYLFTPPNKRRSFCGAQIRTLHRKKTGHTFFVCPTSKVLASQCLNLMTLTPTPEPAPTPDDKDSICKTEAVKTGDHGSVFVWAAGILISVSAVSVVLKRGKYR